MDCLGTKRLSELIHGETSVETRQLGDSGLNVSLICLGTMTWGEQNTPEEAHAQLDMALDYGVNFIDTAELYPVPPKKASYGETERILGQWLKSRGNRDRLVIASKVAGPSDDLNYMRGKSMRLDRVNIEAALHESLKRLQTDCIDLYQLHWPERNTNYFGQLGFEPKDDSSTTPIAESLAVLDDCVKAGKIRHIGISNETPWGAMEFIRAAESTGLPRIVSIQNPYSLLNRTYEIGLAEVSYREKVGLMAYSPLGFGVLSGKYLHNAHPPGARLTRFDRFTRYSNPQALSTTEQYVRLARDHKLDPAQMALAFINTRPFLTSNIIGATNLEQLKSNLESTEIILSDEVLDGIAQIHNSQPNPSP